MQRWTARFLLLFVLAGTFVPMALAAVAPAPACCVRKAVHPCHGMGSMDSDEMAADSSATGRSAEDRLAIRGSSTCSHDCCRAATTVRWAQPQEQASVVFAENVDFGVTESQPHSPATQFFASQSTRGPPQFSLA